jgi:membrane-associated phospholipid phosphatase
LRIADFKSALKIAPAKTDGNLIVKRAAVFYWLIGIGIGAAATAASFHFDPIVQQFAVEHQSKGALVFMRNVSRIGDWPEHVALGFVLAGLAWWRGSRKWTRIFLSMLIALSLAGVIGHGMKIVTARARPSVKIEELLHPSRLSSNFHSFPSGHASASTAFFGVLFLARRWIGLACLPIPLLIGFSRIYIGAHHLSDVVCGAALGILCALLVAHFFFLQSAAQQE